MKRINLIMALAISIYTLSISLLPVNTYAQTIDTPTESEEPTYVSMIREDRYWIYNIAGGGHASFGPSFDPKIGNDLNIRSEFSGTKEFDGKTYSCFISQILTPQHLAEKLRIPIFYLREENGIVYTYITSEYFFLDDAVESPTSGLEVVLYDFTKSEGDIYEGMANPDISIEPLPLICDGSSIYFEKRKFIIDRIEYETIGDDVCRCVYVHDTCGNNAETIGEVTYMEHKYIEGIGNVPYSLTNKNWEISSEFLPTFQGYYNEYNHDYLIVETRLVGVYDKAGNQIYAGWPVSAVKEVTGNASQQEPVYYNMQGQTINNPVKGEIYIERTGDSSRKIVF